MMPKGEIRSSKAEIRKKAEFRNPKGLPVPGNPKGVASLSPGLRGTSYPGIEHPANHQPCKGCNTVATDESASPFRGRDARARAWRSNPFRVDDLAHRTPRVARASQPWAQRSHPFRMTADLPRL
jgi:hypothetical protein